MVLIQYFVPITHWSTYLVRCHKHLEYRLICYNFLPDDIKMTMLDRYGTQEGSWGELCE